MDIISKNHFQVINEINEITNFSVSYGGSLEDYLNLLIAEKPIGDLDILIYDKSLIEVLSQKYDLTNPKPSYFNRFMNEQYTKYNTYINDIKIDFLVSDDEFSPDRFIDTLINGTIVSHRNFKYKMEVLSEWVELSKPDDMWAHDKFKKILQKYEDINNQ